MVPMTSSTRQVSATNANPPFGVNVGSSARNSILGRRGATVTTRQVPFRCGTRTVSQPRLSLPGKAFVVSASAVSWIQRGLTRGSRSEARPGLGLLVGTRWCVDRPDSAGTQPVSYTHLRAHETVLDLV